MNYNILIKMRHIMMELMRFVLWHCYKFFPINRNKILVSCFKGRGYTDNPKYIVESLLSKKPDLKIVWLINNRNEKKSIPSNITTCYYNRLSAIYHYITSLIWIDNVRKDEHFIKKDKQFYLQTWHGGGAIKKIEKDAIEQLSEGYVKKAIFDSSSTDLVIAEGTYYANIFRHSYWYDGEIAVTGLPRYDIIVNKENYNDALNKVHSFYGIELEKKIILYAPTFRKGYGFEYYNVDYNRLIDACNKKFDGNFVVFVHLHPNVANKFSELKYNNTTIINATYYPDMQELILVSDVLITDYSSAIVDFCLTGKPAFRYAIDANQYVNERGCYFNFKTDYPFPLALDNDQLIQCIKGFDNAKYQIDLSKYYELLGVVKEGKSASQVADILLDYIDLCDKNALFSKYRDILL